MPEAQGIKSFPQGQATKEGTIEFRWLLLSHSNVPGNWILLSLIAHYPINVGFCMSWYLQAEGQEDETRSFCDGEKKAKTFKKRWLCLEILFKECDCSMGTQSDCDHVGALGKQPLSQLGEAQPALCVMIWADHLETTWLLPFSAWEYFCLE